MLALKGDGWWKKNSANSPWVEEWSVERERESIKNEIGGGGYGYFIREGGNRIFSLVKLIISKANKILSLHIIKQIDIYKTKIARH